MEKNTSETLYSLKFAERVRSVELGPGLRRAELGSWSSQEHLEVRGPSQAWLRWPWVRDFGSWQERELGGDVLKQWGRGSCQRWVELQLEPTARSLFSTGNSSWPQRFLWDDQLAVGVAHSRY